MASGTSPRIEIISLVQSNQKKNDEFRTLDSTKLDDELQMIKKIYQNFNNHQPPTKDTKQRIEELKSKVKTANDHPYSPN